MLQLVKLSLKCGYKNGVSESKWVWPVWRQWERSLPWSPCIHLVTQLKISLTSLETPMYPENTVNKSPWVFLCSHWCLEELVKMPKVNLLRASWWKFYIPTDWFLSSPSIDIECLLLSGTVLGTGDKTVNKIDQNSCSVGANILSIMELFWPPLSSSDSFDCHFNSASSSI